MRLVRRKKMIFLCSACIVFLPLKWILRMKIIQSLLFYYFYFFRIILWFFWFIGFIFNSFKSFNKPTMLIKFIVLIYFNSSWDSRSFSSPEPATIFPYKYKNHLLIFFIQKTLFYRKFSIISLFSKHLQNHFWAYHWIPWR